MRLGIALAAATAAFGLSACNDQANGGGAGSRDQIKVVGSSTVYPFSTLVAEQFVNANPGMKAPVIESNGTGPGMKQLDGSGLALATPIRTGEPARHGTGGRDRG